MGSVGETSEPEALLMAAARRQLLDEGDRVTALHHDHLGSLTLATDEAGARRGERLFHAFGQTRYREGFVDEAAFTGQELDESSSFYAFRFRHLDSATGRWASVDPLFASVTPDSVASLGESTTAYAYVGNNPANSLDPFGLVHWPAAAPIGAGARAGYDAQLAGAVAGTGVAVGVNDTSALLTITSPAGVVSNFVGFNSGLRAHVIPAAGDPLRANAISRTHAEGDVFRQALVAGAGRGATATLIVDRDACGGCGRRGGITGMAQQLGITNLTLVTPDGQRQFDLRPRRVARAARKHHPYAGRPPKGGRGGGGGGTKKGGAAPAAPSAVAVR